MAQVPNQQTMATSKRSLFGFNTEQRPRFSNSAPSKTWRATRLNERMHRALKSEDKADLSVLIGDEIIRCHSVILSFASPKLHSMLPKQELRLSDVEPSHFRLILEIIYSGDTDIPMDLEQAIHVGRAAYNLEVHAAVEYCSTRLRELVQPDTACQILDFARQVCNKYLVDYCWEMILSKSSEVLSAASFIKCERRTLELIVREEGRGCYEFTELQLFQACARWATAHAEEFGSSREALGSALHQIRFLAISAPDLVEYVFPTEILTEREENVIFRCVVTGKDLLPENFTRNKYPRRTAIHHPIIYRLTARSILQQRTLKSKEIADNEGLVENPLRISVNIDAYITAIELFNAGFDSDSHYGWIGEVFLRDSLGTVLTSVKFNCVDSKICFERPYAISAHKVYELQVNYRNPNLKPKVRLVETQTSNISRWTTLCVVNNSITSIADVCFYALNLKCDIFKF